MKLFTRYNRINLAATAILFIVAGLAFYLLLRQVLIRQVDEDLEIEQREITTYAQRYGRLPENVLPVKDQIIDYRKSDDPQPAVFQSLHLYDPAEGHAGQFRQLRFTFRIGAQWYLASVSKSLESTNGLTRAIAVIALGIMLLLLSIAVWVNRAVLRHLWRPFYESLDHIRKFKLSEHETLLLPNTPIEEFALMNATLEEATGKAAYDYRQLKEFTENAAHELQTPLAIIRSRLDLLIQDEQLSEKQSHDIQGIYDAVQRLVQLNHSLLLLTRIGNRQFEERLDMQMNVLLQDKLSELDIMLQQKELAVETRLEAVHWPMNPLLAEVLLNNLLSNAIYHNKQGGHILITLNETTLRIANTGGPSLEGQVLFSRFKQRISATSRTGLGLAIVHEVCQASGLTVSYHYEQGLHVFMVVRK